MADRGGISGLKAWLLVLVSLLDDAALLAVIFLALWLYHVKITWPIILAVCLAVVAYLVVMHKAVVPALRRRKVTGAEGMIGQTGKVIHPLQPEGMIKIKDEYWEARTVSGNIGADEEVEVLGMDGLVLEVRRKKP
jgi:membrane-bound serine protease (ClpP class)